MHSSKKANQWDFRIKAHIGVNAESGLLPTVKGAARHVHDINEVKALLPGKVRCPDFEPLAQASSYYLSRLDEVWCAKICCATKKS